MYFIDWIGIFEYNDSSSDIFNGAARYTSNDRPCQMNIMTQNPVPKDGYACETRVKHIMWSSFGIPIKLCCWLRNTSYLG